MQTFATFIFFAERKKISADELQELDPVELLPFQKQERDKKTSAKKERDLLKSVVVRKTEDVTIAIVGIENQSEVHYAMPVKMMIYDAMNYEKQVRFIAKEHRKKKDYPSSSEFLSGLHKTDRLCPVITITIYWGSEEWDGAKDLMELLQIENGDREIQICSGNA